MAKAAETVIFEVSLDSLKAETFGSSGGTKSVMSPLAGTRATGMILYSSNASGVIGHGAAAKCGSTDRVGLSPGGGYLELPPLNNPATFTLSGLCTSNGAGRYLFVEKKVGAGEWTRVDSIPIINSNATCTDVIANVSTAGSVTLRIIYPAATVNANTFMIYGGATIKVTGMDMSAPELYATNPFTPTGADAALNTSVLTAKFNRAIDKGTGSVTLYKAGGTLVKTVDVTTVAASVVGDSTLSISVSDVTFEGNTQYYVLMDNGAVKGKNAVAFAGISSNATWTFTTKGAASSAKDILTFTIPNQDSSKINGTNISVWVKYKTDVAQLTVSAISLSPAAVVTVPVGWSTSTVIDFSTPQIFTIEAEDQTTQSYTVTVFVNANADATIKSMKLGQGIVSINADEITVRTMAVTQASVPSLTINGAENAAVLFRGSTYADTATLTNVNITGSPIMKVTAADGVNVTNYNIVAVDADTAKLPLTAKGVDAGAKWNTITANNGWLLNATWHSSLYAAASSRSPIRFMTNGDYIMLHCDSAPEKVSYYLRANALTTYKVLLEESADGATWTTAKETTAELPTSDFGKVESPLLQTTRFLKWTISNLAGGGSLMFDEVNVTKFVPGVLSAEKDILSFSLLAANGKTYPGVVDKTSSKVTVMAPSGVSLAGAKASFDLSLKANATVGGVAQVSGTTVNDFASGLTYKITAENGTFTNWAVEINRLDGPTDGIFQFNFSSGTLKAENYVVAGQEIGKVEITGTITQTIGTLNACGQSFRASIALGNTITFPVLPTMGRLEAHGWGVGSDNKQFVVEKKYENGIDWVTVDTVKTRTGCNTPRPIYINAKSPAQIRIRAYETGAILYGVCTIYEADTVTPKLAAANALNPAPATAGLTSRPGKIEMTFSKTVKAGTGNVTLYKASGDVVDTAFDIKGAGVQFNGSKVTINFSKKLALNTAYYILVPAGVIVDESENSFAGITAKTAWTFTTKVTESSDASILGVTLTTVAGTTSVSYGAPIAGTPVAGVTPLAQRVVYKTDPSQLKIAGFTLPAGAVVTSPTDWNTQTYNLVTTPLEITVAAEDNTQARYSLSVSQVVGNHLANITSIRGDYAYARANLKDTSVVLRTVGYNGAYNIPNVLVLLADSAKITVDGKDSINRTSIPNFNVSAAQTLRVVSHNGDSIKNWKISATDIGKANVPVHFEGSYNDLSRVLALTNEPGWLPYNMMNEYEQSGNRRPSKMNVPGAYVILALDKVGDSVSYKSRVGADNGYDMELRESADAITWTTLMRHSKDGNNLIGTDAHGVAIGANNLASFKVRLNPSTRYLQWYLVSAGTDGTTTQTRLDDIRVTERTSQSSEKKITKFSINGVNGTVIEALKQIGVTLPAGTDVTALTPTIEISYFATVNPASGVAQDFTNPVEYTVTAENGTTQKYTVTVVVEGGEPNPTAVATNSSTEFVLYPNPVGSTLYIDAEYEVASVAVYNLAGSLMYAVTQSTPSVDLKALPAGVYYVQVKFANGKVGTKLISKQ